MYRIYLKNPVDTADESKGFDKRLFYSPTLLGADVYNITLTVGVNNSGNLTFTVSPTHELFSSFRKLVTIVEVYKDDQIYWRGRVLDMRRNMTNCKTVKCEGMIACLNDIFIRYTPDSYYNKKTGTNNAPSLEDKYVTALISYFAACNDSNRNWYRRVRPGTREIVSVRADGETVVTNIDNVNDKEGEYISTAYDRINRFVTQFNGYLFMHYDGDDTYIDFTNNNDPQTSSIITECSQTVEFGKNLIELDEFLDGSKLCTGLWISGALDDSLSDQTSHKPTPIIYTDKDANTYDAHAQLPKSEGDEQLGPYDEDFGYVMFNLYGLIDHKISGMDIGAVGNMASVRSNIITYAANELRNKQNKALSITISAIDLTLLGFDTDELAIGKMVHVISEPHGIDEWLMCSKIVLNFDNPENNQYTIGGNDISLTGKLYNK